MPPAKAATSGTVSDMEIIRRQRRPTILAHIAVLLCVGVVAILDSHATLGIDAAPFGLSALIVVAGVLARPSIVAGGAVTQAMAVT
jgi:hypothetical protein